ncbi:alpha/beta hydrolase [Agrobacterium sp. SOY23]|uniref:alpha/beta hydrolase n=1 Tax=Agrobacterium sp. SOY23 TaxID=3014555 RepID=UPI0022AFBCA1|nr:alpha/beta hydrolase [Agrobacterium sp. SOY23]MCZ4433033.1 alpha/beta hydrolase [Agrobacterium sp. SOY23]
MSRSDVAFWSEGDQLRGWFYRPEEKVERYPAIVMAHGFSAVKEQYLDRYAEKFAESGFGVLVFDHGCFGASDGQPRFEVDPERQRRGYKDAISFVQTIDGPDPDRIGIWGTSYSGGHVLVVAAEDRRVKAVVSQVPTISGSKVAVRRSKTPQASYLREQLAKDRTVRVLSNERGYVSVVSRDHDTPCALPGVDSFEYFTTSSTFAPNWNPDVTIRSLELARANEPGAYIRFISPTPLLMLVAEDDHLTPTDLALDAFDRAGEPKALEMLPGGHFEPYTTLFDRSCEAATSWFQKHL